MADYLVSRVGGAPPTSIPIEEFTGNMFFHLWQVRANPFSVLEDGDTLWWVDQRTREVRWELRARNIRRQQCASIDSAREYLRRWYGIFPGDLSGYKTDGSFRNGWLLAWENEIVSTASGVLPGGFTLGRNGFRRLDSVELGELGLRRSKTAPLRTVQPLEEQHLLAPPRERAIPAEVARCVWQRDGRTCQHCGTVDGPFHLDHIYPWSKGGPNTIENLQVLCAKCNLSKSARVDGDLRPVVPSLPLLADVASRLGVPVPSNPQDLRSLIVEAADALDEWQVVELALQVFMHEHTHREVADAVREALYECDQPIRSWRAILDSIVYDKVPEALLACSSDRNEFGRAVNAVACVQSESDEAEATRYAREAVKSSHPYVAAMGHLVLGWHLGGDRTIKHLSIAFDSGSHDVAARAALGLGFQLADDGTAISYLHYAVRAKNRWTAQAATLGLAERFASDPDIADYYRAKADEFNPG